MPPFTPLGVVTLTYSGRPDASGSKRPSGSVAENDSRLQQQELPEDRISEAFCATALEMIRYHVWRRGLGWQEGEDTARDFLAFVLEHKALFLRPDLNRSEQRALLYRCADNWVKNALQTRERHRLVMVPLADLEASLHGSQLNTLPACDPSPEARLIREELRGHVRASVRLLSPAYQALYVGYYEQDRSIQELARILHRKAKAIRWALWNLRNQIRRRLEQADMDETEIRDYRHESAPW